MRTATAAAAKSAPGRRSDPAVRRVAVDLPALQGVGQSVEIVVAVETVAQQDVWEAGALDDRLGGLVVPAEDEVGSRAAQDAGVGELGGAGVACCVHHRLVLRDALAQLAAGDEQDLVPWPERRGQTAGLVVVGDADLHAAGSERGCLLLIADDTGDLVGGDLGQQSLDDQSAEVSGGAGDDDARRWPSPICSCRPDAGLIRDELLPGVTAAGHRR